MRRPQPLKDRIGKFLLNHRWLLLVLLGLSALVFELIEHRGDDNPVDAHFLREVFVFGVVFPLAVGVLIDMLLKMQDERNVLLRRQAYERRFQQEIRQATHWTELWRMVVHFPQTVLPVVGSVLFENNSADNELKWVAEWWLVDGPREREGQAPLSATVCGLTEHAPGQVLHSFAAPSFSANGLRGYCLPLWNDDHFSGLLQFYLAGDEPLEAEEVAIFNHLASSMALAMETGVVENPQFLQAVAVSRERERVARRLHDSLAQNLSYLRLKLDELVEGEALRQRPAMHRELARMRDVANESYGQVQHTIVDLNLESARSLQEDMLAQAQLAAERGGFELQHRFEGDVSPIHTEVQHKILFIFREALANVRHHAQAKTVTLTMAWTAEDLRVDLVDDGVGFDPSEPVARGHFGRQIMRQRATEIEARLSVQSEPRKGTRVTLVCSLAAS